MESYLDGVYPTTAFESATPVRNISYYSALAFTQWLSEKSGKQVSLPSNAEWEYAAASVDGYASTLNAYRTGDSPSGMFGGLWEITGESYIPLERYLDGTVDAPSDETLIIIKGGSYLNDASEIDRCSTRC